MRLRSLRVLAAVLVASGTDRQAVHRRRRRIVLVSDGWRLVGDYRD